jgi:TonB dependent receptor/Carboxypeptidase regulatory-like domain
LRRAGSVLRARQGIILAAQYKNTAVHQRSAPLKLLRKRSDRVSSTIHVAFLFGILIFAIPGLAQQPGTASQAAPASLSGKVTTTTGQNTTNNLGGITVKLTGPVPASSSQTAVTDAEGRFQFSHLVPGSYSVEAVIEGFKPQVSNVTIASGQAATEDIDVKINAVEERVEVQGEVTEIATQSVSATASANEQQLENLPLRTGKFTEALSISPGVIRTHEGKLNFNGQAESQGMLLVDSSENVDPVSGSFAIPIPVDAIQNIQVFNTPDSSAYGGFSGGLTRIDLIPPAPTWNFKVLDIVPSFRAKNDHLIGLLNMTPRVVFGGPLIKNKLNFAEHITYEFRKDPVHGLSWPLNETITYGLTSLTEFQYTFSPKHLLNINMNVFPSTILFANINTLIPQAASANFRRRGVSLGLSDSYQFDSGMTLTTVVRYTNFYTAEHGQGSAGMTINPEGWGGNYFNAFWRNANQAEALPIVRLPTKTWYGHHEVQFGADFLYRTFTASTVSQPIELLTEAGTVAENINFLGAGRMHGTDTEVSGYAEDRWSLTKTFSLNFGGRLTHQTNGRDIAFAPRGGLAYSMADGKFVLRAGTGLVYGHVPLLALDFAGNQQRVITFSSGPFAGEPITLQNVYQTASSTVNSLSLIDTNNSPRTFTWNLESEISLRKDLSLRLGYFETHSVNLFVVDPTLPVTGTAGFLALRNTGSSNYREFEATARYRRGERAEVNVSYAWSRARGDLNTISDVYIPVAVPVIRPNVYGIESSDIPNRVVTWGYVNLPWKLVFSPVVDIHTGFPYSNVDVQQNYVGVPNSFRFPVYFSLDVKLARDFTFRIPFNEHSKVRKIHIGIFSLDVTNRLNPNDVFSNVTSPRFGQFAGFLRRLTGLEINLGQ